MAGPVPFLKNKVVNVTTSLGRYYRRSALRNMWLGRRVRRRTTRAISGSHNFVLFLIPGVDNVNGGIMSICSIASHTRDILRAGTQVIVCTALGEPRLLRLTKFENDTEILAFADLLPRFPKGAKILVQVPELFVQKYIVDDCEAYRSRPDIEWSFNVLLQNVDLMPSKKAINAVKALGNTTATTAHKASESIAQSLGCPVHYLSWGLFASDFTRVPYSQKQNLIVISPDPHPAKNKIVKQFTETLPEYKITEIRNMTYQQYKAVIRNAKFTFTFGEGLDGYFVESIFSGAIAIAIYRERFFTPEYRQLDGIFLSQEDAVTNLAAFLKRAHEGVEHGKIAQRQYEMVSREFDQTKYLLNIQSYYQKFHPEWI